MGEILMTYYEKMHAYFGALHWWPGESPFEVALGAILTQNTAWSNVEKAIVNLKEAGGLAFAPLSAMEEERLARLIRPAGYYNQKAKKIKAFLEFLGLHYGGSLSAMEKEPLSRVREMLLGVHGIGPETADSILLYALEKPVFVVDAYTKRVFGRHGFFSEKAGYGDVQDFFMRNLPRDVQLFNEYHAQIVYTGKHFCRTKPLCSECPLREMGKAGE